MKDTIICDLDGTLADCTHRRHLVEKYHPDGTKNKRDFEQFYNLCGEDPVCEVVHTLLHKLLAIGFSVVFVTGRPERTRDKTEQWLWRAGFERGHKALYSALYMRPDNDIRADYITKQEILDKHIDKDRILFCLDDRQQVVDMWRRNGLGCFQVAKGDF